MTSPDWDIDYADGAQSELVVADLRRALQEGRVEVKSDRRFIETGNIYVETECNYPRGGWRRTGISNPDTAPQWVYVLRDTGIALVFDVETLRRMAYDPGCSWASQCRQGGHPTRGRLVKVSAAMRQGMFA
jgi:hypothetical protein